MTTVKSLQRALRLFTAVTTILWSVGGSFVSFVPTARAAVTTAAVDLTSGVLRLRQGGSLTAALKFVVQDAGSVPSDKELRAVTVSFTPVSGTPTWTASAATSSELANLADDSTSGVTLWKEAANAGFSSADDTFIMPTASPVYSASNVFTFTLATPVSLATNDIFYVVLKPDSSGVNGGQPMNFGNSFTVTLPANGIATATASPTITALTTPPITMDTESPVVEGAMLVDSKTVDVTFREELDSTTVANGAFTLTTADGGDNSAITSVTLQPDGRTVRVFATAANIAAGSDTIAVSSAVKDRAGNANASTAALNIMSSFQPLVISEVMIGRTGEATKEFVEIYNRSNGVIDLNPGNGTAGATSAMPLALHFVSSAGADSAISLTFGADSADDIPGNGFFLIASTDYSAADYPTVAANATYNAATASLQANSAVYISTSSTANAGLIDLVGWGSATMHEGPSISTSLADDGQSAERKANPQSTAVTMAAGGADAGFGNSYDSQNNSFDFVTRATALPQNAASAAETPGGGAPNQRPFIEHTAPFQVTVGSDATFVARVADDSGTLSASNVKLFYCLATARTGCDTATGGEFDTSAKVLPGNSIGANYFKFTLPSGTTGFSTSNKLYYYISATDNAASPLTAKITGSPSADISDQNGAAPSGYPYNVAFEVTVVAADASKADLTGTVQAGSTGLQGATVFVRETGQSATTLSDGAFSLSDVPPGFFNLVAVKDSYLDQQRGVQVPASGTLAITPAFSLTSGTAGAGGDINRPRVMYSGPPDQATFVPVGMPPEAPTTGMPLFAVFSEPMQASTVADDNATGSSDNIYLTLDGSAKTAGRVIWCPTASAACQDASAASYARPNFVPTDGNMAVFLPTAVLLAGKTYALVFGPGVKDQAGNPLDGNMTSGGHVITFSTSSGEFFGSTGDAGGGFSGSGATFGTGAAFPPFVQGTTPAPGSFNVPVNSNIIVIFSEAMQSSSLSSATVMLVPLNSSGVEQTAISATYSLDTATSSFLTVNPFGNTATNLIDTTKYRLKVLGGVTSAKGVSMANPMETGYATRQVFVTEFSTSSSTSGDTAAPTVLGTVPANAATGIIPSLSYIEVVFSEGMDPTTITTGTVLLKAGSSLVNASVDYDPLERRAGILPNTGLTPGATYTIQIVSGSSGVKDLSGNQLASDSTATFTVSSAADTTSPEVVSVQANDFSIAITFSKAMNRASFTDSVNFPASVLKVANYLVKIGSAGSTLNATTGTTIDLINATLEYDGFENTVRLFDVPGLVSTNDLWVQVSSVKDVSGNDIATSGTPAKNTGRATIKSSAGMGGFLGPGQTSSSVFAPPPPPSDFTSAGIGFIPPAMVRAFNPTAGATSRYGIELPISKQIDASGSITLTFPSGYNISGAKKTSTANSPRNTDLNGPGAGTVVFRGADAGYTPPTGFVTGTADDGVFVNADTRQVLVVLGAVPTRSENSDTHDFLGFDLDGIVNPSIAKDFTTSGYSVSITTKKADGSALDTATSMPIFIGAGGSFTVRGQVTSGATKLNNVKVFLMSPLIGQQEATTASLDFGSGADNGRFQFTSLPGGDYAIMTEPNPTTDGGTTFYLGQSTPNPVRVSSANCSSSVCTSNFSLTAESSGSLATVTVNITGPASEPLDVFAGGPSGFTAKQLTLSGGGTGTATFKLAAGQWFVGTGPQMPKGGFMAGPPPTPTYVMPKPVDVLVVDSSTVKEGSGTADDGTIAFTLSTANRTIPGTVRDASGNAIGSADVHAYSPNAGFGTFAKAKADGTFSLSVVDGSYIVGANAPGFPPGQEVPVEVRSGSVYLSGSSTATTNVIIKLAKPDRTISGKVTDGTNTIPGAGVYAYKTTGPGHADARTDSSGNYTLYVGTGTWKVGAYLPGYGQLPEQTATITTADVSSLNFSPTSGNTSFFTISGTVFKSADATIDSGEGVAGAFVRIEGTSYQNGTNTDSAGAYSLRVPQGSGYTVKVFLPGLGEVPAVTEALAAINPLTVSADATKNVRVIPPSTVTITTSATVAKAFIDFFNTADNVGAHAEITNGATAKISLPGAAGASKSYSIRVFIEGIPPSSLTLSGTGVASGELTVDGGNDETVVITLPTLSAISGTVRDGTGTAVGKAWVNIVQPSSGVHSNAQADSAGAYSISVPNGSYKINAMKPGYVGTPVDLTVSGSATQDLTLGTAGATVSGQVTVSSVAVANAFVKAERQGTVGFAATQTDASGSYSLSLSAGDWVVSAVAEGYAPVNANSGNALTVTASSSTTGVNIALSSTVTVKQPFVTPIAPATGGTLKDTQSGVELTIPASALGTSSDNGNVSTKETNNVVETSTAEPVGDGVVITAADSNGSPITSLNDSVTVKMPFTDAELAAAWTAAGNSGSPVASDEQKLAIGYWDSTAQDWVTVPATVDAANNTLTASVDHFTTFVVLMPFTATAVQAATTSSTTPGGAVSSASSSTGPSNPAVTINSGASSTTSGSVTLTLSAGNATKMAIANSSSFAGSIWEDYQTTKSWQLLAGEGVRTVYAKFRDSSGAVSSLASDSITVVAPGTSVDLATPGVPATVPANVRTDLPKSGTASSAGGQTAVSGSVSSVSVTVPKQAVVAGRRLLTASLPVKFRPRLPKGYAVLGDTFVSRVQNEKTGKTTKDGRLRQRVSISITVDPSKLAGKKANRNVYIVVYDALRRRWNTKNTRVNLKTGTVSTNTNQVGVYAVMVR